MKYKDKFTEVSYWELDYSDFEQIVKEVYDIDDYDFVADQECGNDSAHRFNLDTDKWEEYEERELIEFIEDGNYSYTTNVLIKDLIRKELIPKSDILITVCW